MKEFGIDISAHKRNFDFGMAVSEGVKFILPRGAYSAPAVVSGGGRDTAFVDYYGKSVATGLPVGFYQYGMAATEEEALAEAKYFEETVLSGRKFDLPVYYDKGEASRAFGVYALPLTVIISAIAALARPVADEEVDHAA